MGSEAAGTGRRRLTPDERAAAAALYRAGLPVADIAQQIGCSERTVASICRGIGRQQAPAATSSRRRKPREQLRADYRALGEPPVDPLARSVWMGEMLAVAMRHAAVDDPDGDEADLRRELVALARATGHLVPKERLFEVEQLIRGDMARLDEDDGPEMEPVPNGAPAPKRGTARRSR